MALGMRTTVRTTNGLLGVHVKRCSFEIYSLNQKIDKKMTRRSVGFRTNFVLIVVNVDLNPTFLPSQCQLEVVELL